MGKVIIENRVLTFSNSRQIKIDDIARVDADYSFIRSIRKLFVFTATQGALEDLNRNKDLLIIQTKNGRKIKYKCNGAALITQQINSMISE